MARNRRLGRLLQIHEGQWVPARRFRVFEEESIMLTDNEILAQMQKGEILIKPFERKNLGPNSYDIRIGSRVRSLKYNFKTIDLTKLDQYTFMDQDLPYALDPEDIIIFSSKEVLGCGKKTIGLLSPRSNLSRSGLVFQFSHLLDTGFCGVVSGMVYNPTRATIIIPKGLRVMQIMFDFNYGGLATQYKERQSSKNTNQFSIEDIKYKPDKEWREKQGNECWS